MISPVILTALTGLCVESANKLTIDSWPTNGKFTTESFRNRDQMSVDCSSLSTMSCFTLVCF